MGKRKPVTKRFNNAILSSTGWVPALSHCLSEMVVFNWWQLFRMTKKVATNSKLNKQLENEKLEYQDIKPNLMRRKRHAQNILKNP